MSWDPCADTYRPQNRGEAGLLKGRWLARRKSCGLRHRRTEGGGRAEGVARTDAGFVRGQRPGSACSADPRDRPTRPRPERQRRTRTGRSPGTRAARTRKTTRTRPTPVIRFHAMDRGSGRVGEPVVLVRDVVNRPGESSSSQPRSTRRFSFARAPSISTGTPLGSRTARAPNGYPDRDAFRTLRYSQSNDLPITSIARRRLKRPIG